MPPPRRCPAAILLLLLAGGCKAPAGGTYDTMSVAVRDKLTHEPVAGAVVHARAVHFYIPASYIFRTELFGDRDPIWQSGEPDSAEGVTGADGTVELIVVADHPVQFIVTVAGYQPQMVHLEEHPGVTGAASGWLDTDPGLQVPGEVRRLEVQFRP